VPKPVAMRSPRRCTPPAQVLDVTPNVRKLANSVHLISFCSPHRGIGQAAKAWAKPSLHRQLPMAGSSASPRTAPHAAIPWQGWGKAVPRPHRCRKAKCDQPRRRQHKCPDSQDRPAKASARIPGRRALRLHASCSSCDETLAAFAPSKRITRASSAEPPSLQQRPATKTFQSHPRPAGV